MSGITSRPLIPEVDTPERLQAEAACRLYTRQDAEFLNEQLWPQRFEWLRQRLETMHKVFAPIVKSLTFPEAQ